MKLSALKKSGVFWLIMSVLSFSLMQVFIRLTSDSVTLFLQVAFRNLVGIFVAGWFIKKDGLSWFGSWKEQPFLFGRSVAGFLGIICFFYATRHATIADAIIVNRTGPFFTSLFSMIFLKERVSTKQWAALFIVFIGGVVAAKPTFDSSAIPLLAAMISAIMNGIAYTLLAHFKGKVPTMTVIMHFSAFSVAASIPFLWNHFTIPNGHDILMLLLIAITGSAGQITITTAYRLAPASEISIYDQLGVVASLLFGWLFLNEIPAVHTLLGAAIVIGASTWIFLGNRRQFKRR